ncbi:uncharacterized protein At5g01610-like [Wolffia australiana]
MASSVAYLVVLFSLYVAGSAIAEELPPVQDSLPAYGLPKGLLPNAVSTYSLSDDGHFVVELASPCYVQFSHLVYYDRIIKGKLSYGKVTEISGIQAKELFVWVSVTGLALTPDGKHIQFQSGIFSEDLPISMFAEIPNCKKHGSAGPCHGRKSGGQMAVAAE